MVVGLIIAMAGGAVIERLHMEKYVEGFIFSAGGVDIESPELTQKERLAYAVIEEIEKQVIRLKERLLASTEIGKDL